MQSGLTAGMTRTRRFDVDDERSIKFMGDDLSIYATPFMVRDIERTCRDLLGEFLTEEENSVGSRIEVDHLGPTLKGMWVEVTATVSGVDGRRADFEAEVRDATGIVGRAKHVRYVVNLDRQRERLMAKAAEVAQLQKG